MASEIISRSDAKAKGLSRYFTGKPCKHGHLALRRTINGVCVECIRDIDNLCREKHRDRFRAKWRKASIGARKRNPEAVRLKNSKWSKANRDKENSKKKKWRVANRDRDLESSRALARKKRALNPEKFRLKNKKYKTENAARLEPIARERVKKWRAENPEKVRENGRKISQHRRARALQAGGTYTNAEVRALLENQNWLCATPRCGASLREKKELDHIIALARGGSNNITNLQWLCARCNRRKQARSPEEWAIVCERMFPLTKEIPT